MLRQARRITIPLGSSFPARRGAVFAVPLYIQRQDLGCSIRHSVGERNIPLLLQCHWVQGCFQRCWCALLLSPPRIVGLPGTALRIHASTSDVSSSVGRNSAVDVSCTACPALGSRHLVAQAMAGELFHASQGADGTKSGSALHLRRHGTNLRWVSHTAYPWCHTPLPYECSLEWTRLEQERAMNKHV